MSILIQGTEIQNSQGQSTSIVKLYGVPFINTLRARDTDCVIVLNGRRNNEERIVSESYSTVSALASLGHSDFVIPITVKAVSGVNRDSYPYSLSIKASQIVEVYANPQDSNDSIIRVRDEEKIEDVYYTVDETLADIVALAIPAAYKSYKALLSQNAPVASQTSGTVPAGSIWTIETFETGDDFSNWELISGTGNTTGDVYRALTTTPTTWANGSDLSYDGAPYVVSKNANNEFAPLENTLSGDLTWIYNVAGSYGATLVGEFTEGKTFILCSQAGPDTLVSNNRLDVDTITVKTYDISSVALTDSRLQNNSLVIKVYP